MFRLAYLLVPTLIASAAMAAPGSGPVDHSAGAGFPESTAATQDLVRAHKRLGVRSPALRELARQLAGTRRHLAFVQRSARGGDDADALGLLEAHVQRLQTLLDEARREAEGNPPLAEKLALVAPRFEQLFGQVDTLQAEANSAARARMAGEIASGLPLAPVVNPIALRSPTVTHRLVPSASPGQRGGGKVIVPGRGWVDRASAGRER